MNKLVPLLFAVLAIGCGGPNKSNRLLNEPVAHLYDSSLRPFYHGVASGDPLPDRVIIWTRVTPPDSVERVAVSWEVSEDPVFESIYSSDTLSAYASRDYTVKVDVSGLRPDRVYYYRFKTLDATSMTGRTKTAPIEAKDSLKFAIVSCSNWEGGYFTAYDKIADRPILDAVLHLGDYIYEYQVGKYGDTTIGRLNIPPHEIVSLSDYRTRYSLYRLDRGLRRIHQQHPFIAIWDDHEIANNSFATGAQNHQPEKEGDYETRKAAAKKAYYEWLPIREGTELYRSYSFGPLADVIMLDERLAGRSPEIKDQQDPTYLSAERSMLGPSQLQWFETTLKKSKATWKVIGNQVIFSDVYLQAVIPKMPRNMDSWDGFPFEKKKIVDFLAANKIQDVIITSGDTHASWAIEAAIGVGKTYSPFAVELGTTSISSPNGDEKSHPDSVKLSEQKLLKANPHIKYGNNRDHGYVLLTLYPGSAKAEWYFVSTVREQESDEFFGARFDVMKGSARLQKR